MLLYTVVHTHWYHILHLLNLISILYSVFHWAAAAPEIYNQGSIKIYVISFYIQRHMEPQLMMCRKHPSEPF